MNDYLKILLTHGLVALASVAGTVYVLSVRLEGRLTRLETKVDMLLNNSAGEPKTLKGGESWQLVRK